MIPRTPKVITDLRRRMDSRMNDNGWDTYRNLRNTSAEFKLEKEPIMKEFILENYDKHYNWWWVGYNQYWGVRRLKDNYGYE